MNRTSKLRRVASVLAASVLALGASKAAQAAPPDPMATPPPGSPNTVPDRALPVQLRRFELSCIGAAPMKFSEANGLESQAGIVQYKDAQKGESITKHTPAGALKFATIELKGPATADTTLFKWREMVVRGDLAHAKRSCELAAFDGDGAAVSRYALRGAYPTKYSHAGLSAKANQVAETAVTLAVESVTKLK